MRLGVAAFTLMATLAALAWAEPPPIGASSPADNQQLQNERLLGAKIDKLRAEIDQIRSETSGYLFWLKALGSALTILGAMCAYLFGQDRVNRSRLQSERYRDEQQFLLEHRRQVDATYQAMVQELCAKSPLLRAAAAVKLGKLLESFPTEWAVDRDRQQELVDLTKRVLAASLATENDAKVLKTLTIALALHRPWKADADPELRRRADLRGIDLSGARARDAYWARCDLTETDFYAADLTRASLRASTMSYAQFREAKLNDAVLDGAMGEGTNFKLADLRGASLKGAALKGASFENARVARAVLDGATIEKPHPCRVDVAEDGEAPRWVAVEDWLASRASTGHS